MNSALQAAQHELERSRVTDNLKKGLEHRPDREDLVQRMSSLLTIVSLISKALNRRKCLTCKITEDGTQY